MIGLAYLAVLVVVTTPFVGLVIRMRHYVAATRREWLEAAAGVFVLGVLFVALELWTIIGATLVANP